MVRTDREPRSEMVRRLSTLRREHVRTIVHSGMLQRATEVGKSKNLPAGEAAIYVTKSWANGTEFLCLSVSDRPLEYWVPVPVAQRDKNDKSGLRHEDGFKQEDAVRIAEMSDQLEEVRQADKTLLSGDYNFDVVLGN